MKKSQYIFGALALIAFPNWAQAQTQAKDTTLSRTVVVEQEYNPDIMDASKVNVLPQVAPPTVSKKAVEYDATLVPEGNIPASTMQAYTGTESQDKAQRGYARLGYGNYGNLDVRANYLFILPNSDKLNLNFHMNGMDGKLKVPDLAEKWDARYYRTRVGMDYVHAFRKVDLNVAGNFGLSNFNFMPYSINNKQKFLSGDVHFGVKSTSEDLPFQFHAETNLMFYERQYDLSQKDAQEAMVRTKAGAVGSISEEQSVGVDLTMDNVFYKNNLFDDYTSVELTTCIRMMTGKSDSVPMWILLSDLVRSSEYHRTSLPNIFSLTVTFFMPRPQADAEPMTSAGWKPFRLTDRVKYSWMPLTSN